MGSPATTGNQRQQDPPGPSGLLPFAAFWGLGAASPLFFNAIALASDLVPLKEDLWACLGIDGEAKQPRINYQTAIPSLIILGLVIVVVLASEPCMNGFNCASGILPLRDDFGTLLGRPSGQGSASQG